MPFIFIRIRLNKTQKTGMRPTSSFPAGFNTASFWYFDGFMLTNICYNVVVMVYSETRQDSINIIKGDLRDEKLGIPSFSENIR